MIRQCEQNLPDTTNNIKRPLGLHLTTLKIRDKMEILDRELKTIKKNEMGYPEWKITRTEINSLEAITDLT